MAASLGDCLPRKAANRVFSEERSVRASRDIRDQGTLIDEFLLAIYLSPAPLRDAKGACLPTRKSPYCISCYECIDSQGSVLTTAPVQKLHAFTLLLKVYGTGCPCE